MQLLYVVAHLITQLRNAAIVLPTVVAYATACSYVVAHLITQLRNAVVVLPTVVAYATAQLCCVTFDRTIARCCCSRYSCLAAVT